MKNTAIEEKTNIGEDVMNQVEEIIQEIKCPKDFVCYKSGFTKICKARDIGLDNFVACLVRDPLSCKFSIHFGELFFCQCALRIYICKKMRK